MCTSQNLNFKVPRQLLNRADWVLAARRPGPGGDAVGARRAGPSAELGRPRERPQIQGPARVLAAPRLRLSLGLRPERAHAADSRLRNPEH